MNTSKKERGHNNREEKRKLQTLDFRGGREELEDLTRGAKNLATAAAPRVIYPTQSGITR